MSRGQLTAVVAALAMGAFAPRLMAQDTSATRETRPDTSGYNGTAGIDTAAQPGRVGALDSTGIGLDSMRSGADTMGTPGRTSPSDSSAASDSASVSQPTKQPGQSTSRTGDSASSTGP